MRWLICLMPLLRISILFEACSSSNAPRAAHVDDVGSVEVDLVGTVEVSPAAGCGSQWSAPTRRKAGLAYAPALPLPFTPAEPFFASAIISLTLLSNSSHFS